MYTPKMEKKKNDDVYVYFQSHLVKYIVSESKCSTYTQKTIYNNATQPHL